MDDIIHTEADLNTYQFKGDEHTPKSVPDSISADGWIAPESVTESTSKETGIFPAIRVCRI